MPRYLSIFDDIETLQALAQAVDPKKTVQPVDYQGNMPVEWLNPRDPNALPPDKDFNREHHLQGIRLLLTNLLQDLQEPPKLSDFSSLKDVIAFLQAHQITNAAGQPIVDASGNVKDQAGLAAYIKQYAQTAEQAGGFVGNQMKAHMQTIIAELNQAPQLGEAARELAGQPAQPQQGQAPQQAGAGQQPAAQQGRSDLGNVENLMPFNDGGGYFNPDRLMIWPSEFLNTVGNQGTDLDSYIENIRGDLNQAIGQYKNATLGTSRARGFSYGADPSKEDLAQNFLVAFKDNPFRGAQALRAATDIVDSFLTSFQAIQGVSGNFYRSYKGTIDKQIEFMRLFHAALSAAADTLQAQAGKEATPNYRGWR